MRPGGGRSVPRRWTRGRPSFSPVLPLLVAPMTRPPVYHRGVPLIGGVAALAGSRVAIFGAGMEGRSFARHVGPICAELVLVDDIAGDPSVLTGPRQAVEAEPAVIDVQPPSILELRRFDFVVHSPGVRATTSASVPQRGSVRW